MLLGTCGCLTNTIALILKYLIKDSEDLWIPSTLLNMIGWTIYAPAQLLVLYSRLHLINQNRRHQRWILIMIIVVSCLMIIPSWVFIWMAWNPYDKHISAVWSPREAILDRITQLGYTLAEGVVSGTYIWSLIKLLSLKSSVRQRRVMTDLIYVNIIINCLDILTVCLVFLNQVGISHPIQTFSYMIKFKLEFLVLNQLMAVAARGKRKERFGDRRYHHPCHAVEYKGSDKQGLVSRQHSEDTSLKELIVPQPTLSQVHSASGAGAAPDSKHQSSHRRWPLKAKFKKHGSKPTGYGDDAEDEEIGVHMWENRGKLVMEVPWFKTGNSI